MKKVVESDIAELKKIFVNFQGSYGIDNSETHHHLNDDLSSKIFVLHVEKCFSS